MTNKPDAIIVDIDGTGGLWIPFYVPHYVMFSKRNNRNYR